MAENSLAVVTPAQLIVSNKSKYPAEQWLQVRDFVENSDKSLSDIALEVGMPYSIMEKTARRKGWLVTRQTATAKQADKTLRTIVRDVAYQINDLNKHEKAELEALQYSYRIQIVVDDDGEFHYKNFEDFPGRPGNWEELDDLTKQAHLSYIQPPRLEAFLKSLNRLKIDKLAKLEFVTKLVKGSLPKIDPDALNISTRDVDVIGGLQTDTSIFAEKKTPKVDKLVSEAEENFEQVESKE